MQPVAQLTGVHWLLVSHQHSVAPSPMHLAVSVPLTQAPEQAAGEGSQTLVVGLQVVPTAQPVVVQSTVSMQSLLVASHWKPAAQPSRVQSVVATHSLEVASHSKPGAQPVTVQSVVGLHSLVVASHS